MRLDEMKYKMFENIHDQIALSYSFICAITRKTLAQTLLFIMMQYFQNISNLNIMGLKKKFSKAFLMITALNIISLRALQVLM